MEHVCRNGLSAAAGHCLRGAYLSVKKKPVRSQRSQAEAWSAIGAFARLPAAAPFSAYFTTTRLLRLAVGVCTRSRYRPGARCRPLIVRALGPGRSETDWVCMFFPETVTSCT